MSKHSNKANANAVELSAVQRNTLTRSATRVLAVLAVRKQHHEARVSAREAAAAALAKTQAFHAELAQLQERYGVSLAAAKARANSSTAQPSAAMVTIEGVQYTPCKAVHAIATLCNGVRKATLAMCKQYGINPATASTQYGIYKKNLASIAANNGDEETVH